jgi:hypothetical protein
VVSGGFAAKYHEAGPRPEEGVAVRQGRRYLPSLASVVAAFLVGVASPGHACSICRCGDPTFNALGKQGFQGKGLRLALDWERFDKEEGDPAEESEAQVENRYTLLASYGFSDRFSLTARVPASWRRLTTAEPGSDTAVVETSGLSDPEIYGQVRLWASPMRLGLGRRDAVSVVAGVKTPWGENDVTSGGERVDEHAQPGTGSTDVLGSLVLLHLIDDRSALFLSGGYRHTGENDYGYRYGSSFTANAAYEHKLGSRLDGVVELNFRHAKEDAVDAEGTLDGNTGGSLLYVTPRLLVRLGRGLVLRAGAQLPVLKHLNGYQTEKAVANVGLTYVFAH